MSTNTIAAAEPGNLSGEFLEAGADESSSGQEIRTYDSSQQGERTYNKRGSINFEGEVHKFSIAGHEGYLRISYKTGTRNPDKILIDMAKEGSTLGGLMDGLADMMSLVLQMGGSQGLEDLVNSNIGTRFEPQGHTTNPDIPETSSIRDYIARYFLLNYIMPKDPLRGEWILQKARKIQGYEFEGNSPPNGERPAN